MLDRMSDALALLAAPLIDAAARSARPERRRRARAARGRRPRRLRDDARAAAREAAAAARRARSPRSCARGAAASALGGERQGRRPGLRQPAGRRPPGTPRRCAGRCSRVSAAAQPPRRCRDQRRVRLANPTGPLPVRPAATPPTATRSRGCSRSPGTGSRASTTSTTPAPDRALRPLAARPRAGRAGARGRLPGRVRLDRAGARTGLSPDAPAEEFGRARRRGDVRGDPRDARALPRAASTSSPTRSTSTARRRRAALERARRPATSFEADGAIWLRTSEFGDDKDRVAASRPTARPRTSRPTSPT